jgi:hypothetical protein
MRKDVRARIYRSYHRRILLRPCSRETLEADLVRVGRVNGWIR